MLTLEGTPTRPVDPPCRRRAPGKGWGKLTKAGGGGGGLRLKAKAEVAQNSGLDKESPARLLGPRTPTPVLYTPPRIRAWVALSLSPAARLLTTALKPGPTGPLPQAGPRGSRGGGSFTSGSNLRRQRRCPGLRP